MRVAKALLLLLAVWIALAAAFSGCTCVVNNYHYGTARPSAMFVANAPPPAKAETQTAAPSRDAVWIKGHWEWSVSEETWLWVAGIWAVPPDGGATWVDPGYEDNNGDWMYIPGYWHWKDPGADEGVDTATPALPPGNLHWVDKRPVGDADSGEPAAPAKPMVPPGALTAGGAESQPETAGPAAAEPKGVGLSAEGSEDAAEPSGIAGKPGLSAEDPYATGEGDGDDGAKRRPGKRKHTDEDKKEMARPFNEKPVQEKPQPPKPHNTVNDDATPGADAARPGDAERPAPKPGKRNKAKSETKDDGKDVSRAKGEDAPKVKKPGKVDISR